MRDDTKNGCVADYGRSRPSDKGRGVGGGGNLKKFFQFGLKIRGAPLLNPPLVKIRSKEASPPKRRVSNPITMANILYQLIEKNFFVTFHCPIDATKQFLLETNYFIHLLI